MQDEINVAPVLEVEPNPALKDPTTNALVHNPFTWDLEDETES